MKILVLGGDGYLGWPTALHLSEQGYDVAVADNFVRRHYDDELGVESLVPIEPLRTRIAVWPASPATRRAHSPSATAAGASAGDFVAI